MSLEKQAPLFVPFVVLALTVWIAATAIHYWRSRPVDTVRERILPRHEWPEPFAKLLGDAERRNLGVARLEVWSGQHDDYYWKCEATPKLLDLMTGSWGLSRVDRNHKVVELVVRRMPSFISPPPSGGRVDYYLSTGYLTEGGGKGDLFCVMNDKERRQLLSGTTTIPENEIDSDHFVEILAARG
jgi:hypothetical protein